MSQRVVIDSLAFARTGGSLQGELPVAGLTRVIDMLTSSAGCLSYHAQGQMGPRDRPQLLLKVNGSLVIRCQRCLEGIDYPVAIHSLLEFVDDEEELTQEEIEDDSKDFLTVQSELDVMDLIEDEVILELPQAPRHDSCALPEAGRQTEKASPFAVLQGLKSKEQ